MKKLQLKYKSKTIRKHFPNFNIDCLWGIPNSIAATLVTLPITFLLQVVISCMCENSLLAELVSNVNEEWYMNTFFSGKNSSPSNQPDSTIYILDIEDCYSSREDIAEVIWAVAAQKPRLICLDMIFPEGQSYDEKMSQHLLDTISIVSQTTPFVVASYLGNESEVSHSYFTDSLNLEHGLSDFLGFQRFTPSIEGHLRISAKVAQMAGVNIDLLPKDLVINYKEKTIGQQPISDREDLDFLPSLMGKIVLIGQRNSPDDMHSTPFLIDQHLQMTGIDIVAYEISSMLADCNLPDYDFFRPYTFCNTAQNFLFFMMMSLLLNLCYHFIRLLMKNHQIWLQWLKFILLIFAEYLIIKACFLLTDWLFIIPNIVLFMLSVLLVEPIYETTYYLTHKSKSAK